RLPAIERTGDDEIAAEPRHERAERRQLEQPWRLVERRLAQERLVAVVQPEQLRRDEQQRHAGETLPRQMQRDASRREDDREHERAEDRDRVGREQRPPERRVTAQTRCGTTSLGGPLNAPLKAR